MGHWSRRIIALGLGMLALGGPAAADMTKPAPVPPSTPAGLTAEDELNSGLRAARREGLHERRGGVPARACSKAHLCRGVERSRLRPAAAGRVPGVAPGLSQALRLRPDFPEALEYLGETYVKLGRLDDARRTLDRLRPLDAARARELAEAIDQGR